MKYMPTRSQLLKLDYYAPFLSNALRIVVILVFAFLATRAIVRMMRALRGYVVKMMLKSGGGNEFELEKRAETIENLAGKALFILIWTIAGLMVLKEMNFDVGPLLAGAGVAGVAIGFGAQNIIKDVLGGLFLMMENQIRVNDVAVINGKTGLVEEINLRTTVLRGEDGAVHIFPNGVIQGLSNLTREYSYYVFNLSVAYTEDIDRVVSILKEYRRRSGPGGTVSRGGAGAHRSSRRGQTGRLGRGDQGPLQDGSQPAVDGGARNEWPHHQAVRRSENRHAVGRAGGQRRDAGCRAERVNRIYTFTSAPSSFTMLDKNDFASPNSISVLSR